ncbi:pyridoxal-phosphate dependent enzyme [Candidatus Uhrbacteria bacterium]|nr:pyridoxal-phosphate dependent enzyme [Candidatus Uhrbacteria bacterium]
MRDRGEAILANREIVKKVEFPQFMSPELMQEWIDRIPRFLSYDLKNPEWRPTPHRVLDLSADGYGIISVKDESVNATGTMKDRPAWELVKLYADYAFGLFLRTSGLTEAKAKDFLATQRIPQCTLITSGNEGTAVAKAFEQYNLPPPKLVVGTTIHTTDEQKIRNLRADVYKIDLSKKISSTMMKLLTENEHGVEITSQSPYFLPNVIFYDWLVHEVFRQKPNDVYVPYGSGRLMENFLTWQSLTLSKGPDDRLGVHPGDANAIQEMVASIQRMNIFGAEPAKKDSQADKLTASFKPFLIFQDRDIRSQVTLRRTGDDTGKFKVREECVTMGYEILKKNGIQAEPSAAAGLALYLQRCDTATKKEKDAMLSRKTLIVNTGKGLDIEPTS